MQNPISQDPQTNSTGDGGNKDIVQSTAVPVPETSKEKVVSEPASVAPTPTPTPANNVQTEPVPTTTETAPVAKVEQKKDKPSSDTAVDKMQEIGKEGVQQVGSVVANVLSPKGPASSQPPVKQDEKIYASLAYVPFVALISIIIKPDSAYVRMHAKQALLLAILFFGSVFMAAIVSLFGIIGQLLAFLFALVLLATIVIGVYSMYLAYMGFWWKIPVLSTVANIIPVEMLAKVSKDNITGQAGVAKQDYDERQAALDKEKKDAVAPEPTVKKEELSKASVQPEKVEQVPTSQPVPDQKEENKPTDQ